MRGALRSALVGGALLLTLLPFAYLLLQSFALRWYFPALLPQEWTGRGWASALAPGTRLLEAAWGSVSTAALSALIGTLVALPAARLLARAPRAALRVLLLAPLVVPAFAALLGVQVVFLRLGLAGTRAGVVLAHLIPVVPYAVTLLTATFETHDERLEAQARSLGARRAQVLWFVTLPVLRAGVGVAFGLAFLVSWSEYLLTLTVGGGRVLTLPVLLLASAQGGDAALTAALAFVYVAPPLLLFLFGGARLWSGAAVGGRP